MSGEIIWVEFPTDASDAVLAALGQTPCVEEITSEGTPSPEYVALGIESMLLREVKELRDFLWAIPGVTRAWLDFTPESSRTEPTG